MPWLLNPRRAAILLLTALVVLTTAALLASQPPSRPAKPAPADLVLRNGAVYTVDAARRWASAVAVRAGRIVWVGEEDGVGPFVGPRTRVIDLAGKMVLPGFHDSHVHLVEGGVDLGQCVLTDGMDREAILAAVLKYAAANPGKAWIEGSGWPLPAFPDANPGKELLDAVVPGRPVYLTAADGHSAWVNSRALAAAGITRETKDPPNGRIERDPKTGEPTGTLREAAKGLVARLLPKTTAEERVAGLRRAVREANRFGITAVEDASASEEQLRAYAELDRRGELTLRAAAALRVDPAKGAADVPRLVELRRRYLRGSGHLRPIAAKIFADGVIESRTAALLAPYLDPATGKETGERGIANYRPEDLDRLVAALDRERFEIHVHAIGDRAIRMTLDAFEKARAVNGRRDSRHQIAHLELVDGADIPRFERLGVIADFQPLWAFADSYIRDLTVPVLGEARSRRLYPLGSIGRTGAVLACGSDWDVTSMNPLEAIQVAVTRRDPAAGPGPAWQPEELADLPALLACYTIGGAYAAFEEGETGSIEPGKAADFAILDRDLFRVPREEISKARVLLTFLAGREVYRRAVPGSGVEPK
jgi:predicted amidohydrolase YtcJ